MQWRWVEFNSVNTLVLSFSLYLAGVVRMILHSNHAVYWCATDTCTCGCHTFSTGKAFLVIAKSLKFFQRSTRAFGTAQDESVRYQHQPLWMKENFVVVIHLCVIIKIFVLKFSMKQRMGLILLQHVYL